MVDLTQQYLAGELSLLLAELQMAMTSHDSEAAITRLRQLAETGSRSELESVARCALSIADSACWDSLSTGDPASFIDRAESGAVLWEFSVCAGLVRQDQVVKTRW